MEKISRKPDIIALQIFNKEFKFCIDGKIQLESSLNFSNTTLTVKDKSVFSLNYKGGVLKWNSFDYEIEGLLMEQQKLILHGKIEVIDENKKIFSRIFVNEEKSSGFLPLPDINLNFWSREETKAVKEVKEKMKNELQIRIYKRLKDHEKMVFSEGISNYARFAQLDGVVFYTHNINNVPIMFESCSLEKEPYLLPTDSTHDGIQELIEGKHYD